MDQLLQKYTQEDFFKLVEDSNGDLSTALDKIIKRPISPNRWGSSQYTITLNVYELLMLLDHHQIPFEKVGITFRNSGWTGKAVSYLPKNYQRYLLTDPLTQTSKEEVYQFLEVELLKIMGDYVIYDIMTEDERYSWNQKYKKECSQGYFDYALKTMNLNLGYNLWIAVDQLTRICFPDLEIEVPKLEKEFRGFILRDQMVLSETSLAGVQCFLLKKYGWIQEEESFVNC